jgi:hypothetical protein
MSAASGFTGTIDPAGCSNLSTSWPGFVPAISIHRAWLSHLNRDHRVTGAAQKKRPPAGELPEAAVSAVRSRDTNGGGALKSDAGHDYRLTSTTD